MAKTSRIVNYNSIVNSLSSLGDDELKALAKKVYSILYQPKGPRNQMVGSKLVSSYSKGDVIVCPHCGDTHVVKRGLDARGNQRYLCRGCRKGFSRTTDTVISHSNKDADAWTKYIIAMLQNQSLAKCAAAAGISARTSVVWRHKIMAAMSNSKFVAKQSGVIEMDEMFFGISYKGNHKHSKHFKMPRPAFKRGSDNIGPYSTKMCVLFSAERGGKSYGRVMGNGVLSVDRLDKTMTPILEPGSLVITDANTILKSYLFDLPLEHKAVPGRSSRTFRKNKKNHTYAPRFYNIQHVNNLHMRFRRFLAPHNGVSSKYLEMYLDYFLWLDNEARAKSSSVDAVAEAITSRGTYNSEAVLCFRAAVPKVA